MIKLKQLLTEMLSNTDLGQNIHSLIESKSDINSFSENLLSHIIKMVMVRDNLYRNSWKKTIKTSLLNISKDKWLKNKNSKFKQEELKSVLENFDLIYISTKDDFDSKESINQFNFPESPSDSQKDFIVKIYNSIVEGLTTKESTSYVNSIYSELDKLIPHLEN